MSSKTIVGLISDTHGLLRPEALQLLRGSDLIVHAGDIGNPEIITELARLAPVTAVLGNVDKGAWATSYADKAVLRVAGAILILVLHSVENLDLDPAAEGFHAVVSGHTHKPGFRWKDGVLYVDPGSAGPRRFSLPISVARLVIDGGELSFDVTEFAGKPP